MGVKRVQRIFAAGDLDRLLQDPQVQARGSLVHIDSPALGSLALAAPSPHLGATPGRIGEIDRLECRRLVEERFSIAAFARRVEEWLDEVVAARASCTGGL